MIGVCMIGGLSDLWTVLLGGNLELTIVMSVVNTGLACVMIPFWTLTLGQALSVIQKPLEIDYTYFIGHIFYLVCPIFVGSIISLPIRCCFPRFSRLVVIILRLISPIYICCVLANAFLENVDMFIPHNIPSQFSWTYIVAGTLLTCVHYMIGCLAALKLKQRYKEKLAIAAQTINKNATISMSIMYPNLFYAEREEAMFLSAVVIMATPLPLLAHVILHKIGQTRGTVSITKSDLK
ncbi:uncharacterized protein LOC129566872 [Sitodiplosis mosellana]|uniref:uncharacterized protein LOC129566872 n=1 Tax=Sitodiplosis mosellana TaxID=263140 RepID=UPI002444733A|nr:uncharacterized protein LOC129566872 [Sitodiplosis mosellana]